MKTICSITILSALLCNCTSKRYLLSDNGKDKYYLSNYIKAEAKKGEISRRPLVVVNGLPFDYQMLKEKRFFFTKAGIKQIETVPSTEATELYGSLAKNGVVRVTKNLSVTLSRYGNSLILLEDKPISADELDKLDLDTIESINIFKGTEKAKKFTADNYASVIVLHLKKS